jgi:phosphoesterase RecJ-like protein
MEDSKKVVEAIRTHDRFLVTTHENPDGDALGSLVAMQLALEQLGADSLTYLAGEVPLPHEYGFMPLGDLRRGARPAEADGRVVLALDCANERRLGPDSALLDQAPLVVNVDHHHDNTRFGDVSLIVPDASSTGEILRGLFADLGVELTPAIAEAIYIAVVTDTGRFQYANTTPAALRLAAELMEAGADTQRVFQGVYESVPFAKLKLLGRALDSARTYEDGRLVIAFLVRQDFADAGATEPFAEGIIDTIRSVEGADMVALVREPPTVDGPTRRVSLRTTAEGIDVSAIARLADGGGHRQAAGFSSEGSADEVADFIHRGFLAQVGSA